MAEAQKHVYILSNDLLVGGIQRLFVRLAAGLADAGVKVTFLTCWNKGPIGETLRDDIPLIVLADAEAPRKSIPHLMKHLKRDKPDAILSGDDSANFVAVVAQKLSGVKTRTVIGVHHSFKMKYGGKQDWRTKLRHSLFKYFYRGADHIVSVSRGAQEEFLEYTGQPESKATVIYPVIQPNIVEKSLETWENPFAASNDPLIVAVGRLHRQKNYPNLIHSLNHVLKKRPANLLILGEGEERAALEALTKELGLQDRVAMPGAVINPYPAMRAADIYALSSLWEGCPAVLCEALRLSLNIVSTDCPFGPDELLQNGKYGRLVPSEKSEALANGILEGLEEGRVTIPDEAWQHLTMDHCVAKHMEVLFGGALSGRAVPVKA